MIRGLMIACVCAALPLAASASAQGDDALIDVPSGQPVTLLDTIIGAPGPDGRTARFRFVAPHIARDLGRVSFVEAEADMQYLCDAYALPRLAHPGPQVSQVIISLSDRPVVFGETAIDATQFFEAYRPEGKTCVWEGF